MFSPFKVAYDSENPSKRESIVVTRGNKLDYYKDKIPDYMLIKFIIYASVVPIFQI